MHEARHSGFRPAAAIAVCVLVGVVLVGVALVSFAARPAFAATFTVNDTGDAGDATPGDGVCETAPANGVCTLRAAVEETNALGGADSISVPAGSIALTTSGSGGQLDITDDVTITGAGVGTTSVDAAGAGTHHRWATIASGKTVTVSAMTLGSGEAPAGEDGGNILNHGILHLDHVTVGHGNAPSGAGGNIWSDGTVTLTNSLVAEGSSNGKGGGINNSGTLTVTDTELVHNDAFSDDGGAIDNSGTATLTRTTIDDGGTPSNGNHAASNGGGIHNTGTLTATSLDVAGNTADGVGGGIGHESGSMTIGADSLIQGNAAVGVGGGIASEGTLSLADTAVTGNSATGSSGPNGIGGGALFVGDATLTRVAITGNTAAGAGAGGFGVANNGSGPPTVTATDLVVSNNTSAGSGGGITVFAFGPLTGPTVTVHRAAVASNTASTGGAIVMTTGTLTLENATISGNTSTTPGAAVVGAVGQGGDLTLSFSTVANNDAGVVQTNTGTVTASASLLADNTGSNCSGTLTSTGSNVDTGTTCALAGTGDLGNVGSMLGSSLGALAANGAPLAGLTTHALLAGNPAISHVAGGCPATDERGTARPASQCSAGAFQYVAPAPPTTSAAPTTSAPATTAGPTTTGQGAVAPGAAGPGPTATVSGTLPRTGANEEGELRLATGAIALGATLVGSARRRRARAC